MFTLNRNVNIEQETFLPDEEFCDFEEATFHGRREPEWRVYFAERNVAILLNLLRKVDLSHFWANLANRARSVRTVRPITFINLLVLFGSPFLQIEL